MRRSFVQLGLEVSELSSKTLKPKVPEEPVEPTNEVNETTLALLISKSYELFGEEKGKQLEEHVRKELAVKAELTDKEWKELKGKIRLSDKGKHPSD